MLAMNTNYDGTSQFASTLLRRKILSDFAITMPSFSNSHNQNRQCFCAQIKNRKCLLLPEIQPHRNTFKVEMFSQFVFKKTHIGIFDVLRCVTEKCDRR